MNRARRREGEGAAVKSRTLAVVDVERNHRVRPPPHARGASSDRLQHQRNTEPCQDRGAALQRPDFTKQLTRRNQSDWESNPQRNATKSTKAIRTDKPRENTNELEKRGSIEGSRAHSRGRPGAGGRTRTHLSRTPGRPRRQGRAGGDGELEELEREGSEWRETIAEEEGASRFGPGVRMNGAVLAEKTPAFSVRSYIVGSDASRRRRIGRRVRPRLRSDGHGRFKTAVGFVRSRGGPRWLGARAGLDLLALEATRPFGSRV